MYIAIGRPDEDQIAAVQKYLEEPFVLLDPRGILKGDSCTYGIQRGEVTLAYNGRLLTNVRSVWYCSYQLVQGFELPVSEGKQKYAQDAIRYFNKLIFTRFSDALWVSDFYAVERAGDKFWQLQVATECGFRVPDTLFTSSPADAAAFARRHKDLIAKPNYSARFMHEDKEYIFYTSRIDASADFAGLRVAPAIIQVAVDVKTELRVTVVADKVFAAAVDSSKVHVAPHVRDWRAPSPTAEATYKAYDLPLPIRKMCVGLVKALGLQYGAIDLIVDKQDRVWFLENNPQGQWEFIERATGLPIGKAIAELLMHGKADGKGSYGRRSRDAVLA